MKFILVLDTLIESWYQLYSHSHEDFDDNVLYDQLCHEVQCQSVLVDHNSCYTKTCIWTC